MGWRGLAAVAVAACTTLAVGAGVGGAYDWSQALAFDVSAQPSVERTWQWSVQEQTSPAQVNLYVGESRPQSFTASVATAGSADTRWLVGGVVSINPNPIVQLTSIEGMLYTGPSSAYTLTPFAITDCPGGLPLMVANKTVCSYQVPAPQANTGFVGVTAHGCIDGSCIYDSKSSSAPFDFATAPVTQRQGCVTASESVAGVLGTVCAPAAPASFVATRPIGPYASCGDYSAASTVSLTSDGSAAGSASAAVRVHVATRFAQWWVANVTSATYSDLVVMLQTQIAALQARLTSADPPAVASALATIQTYLARYPTWSSLSRLQQTVLTGLKNTIDAYALRCD